MARLAVGMVLGVVVGLVAGAAAGLHADEDEVVVAASEAGVDPTQLLGAVNTTGLGPREYLYMTGELSPPRADATDRLIACLEWRESHGVSTAVNPRSGASGPLQFLRGTWMSTPQGRAGMSVFDPAASRAAARWMINQGRLHEWSTWRMCA